MGARRKRKKPTKPKKAKKPKKAAKKAKGAALLSCLVPLQLVCHLPDGLGPVVVYENDLCNSALGGEDHCCFLTTYFPIDGCISVSADSLYCVVS